jgi:SAM-dependent methyltransferase
MTVHTICPACGTRGFTPFYEVASVPLRSSVVLDNAADALAFPTGRLLLASCRACGFVGNAAFDRARRAPHGITEDQQAYSPTFGAYAERFARDLVDRYGLRGRRVVEIGCGRGDFLSLLCETGGNDGIGIDPLFHDGRGRVTAVPEEYALAHARYRPDLIVCRHTLEHVPDPAAFLRTVRSSLDDDTATAVVFEVPDVVRVFDEAAFWDVYYEHCSYFAPGSLARTFRACGFHVFDLYRDYDDQYVVIHARAGRGGGTTPLPGEEDAAAVPALGGRFASAVAVRIAGWRERLSACAGRSAALWGSGSKCVAFVSALGAAGAVGAIVDLNPRRHGKYMPGIGLPIVGPEHLRAHPPETIVAMNPIYRDEIEGVVRAMGLEAAVVAL